MESLDILDRVLSCVECSVNASVPPLVPIKKGDTEIYVETSWSCTANHTPGEQIAIHDNNKIESHIVKCIEKKALDFVYIITLCEPVASDFPEPETTLTKLHDDRLVNDVVIGNPDFLDGYPSITVEPLLVEREGFTLTDWLETHPFDIGIWVDATNYNSAYRLMIRLADLVKNGLANSRLAANLFLQEAEISRFDDAQDRNHLLKSATVRFTVKMLRARRRNDVEQSCFEWWLDNSAEANAYLNHLLGQ
jgi:hypothetical protein